VGRCFAEEEGKFYTAVNEIFNKDLALFYLQDGCGERLNTTVLFLGAFFPVLSFDIVFSETILAASD
jgi:hypothetical protein